MSGDAASHAALMDATYRYQRLIYDATRRYFLFGRDEVIDGLDVPPGGRVLEIACGTGRNLRRIAGRHPGCRLHGLDISSQMLRSARAALGDRARLAQADARSFSAEETFGTDGFERILLSYGVSMIPDWQRAVDRALALLPPGGSLHIVDFGDRAGLPGPARAALDAWLARFHVTPRPDLPRELERLAAAHGCRSEARSRYRGYACIAVLTRPG